LLGSLTVPDSVDANRLPKRSKARSIGPLLGGNCDESANTVLVASEANS
jgi:hypothetical protein